MNIFAQILGWIGFTFSATVIIPQLMKLLFNRKISFNGFKPTIISLPETKLNISVVGYFIFILGQISWVFYYGIFRDDLSTNWQAWLANVGTSITGVITMWVIYTKDNSNKNRYFAITSSLIVLCILTLAIISISGVFSVGTKVAQWIVPIFAGFFTTVSFLPQTIKEMKAKENTSQSMLTIAFNMFANIIWILFFIFDVVANDKSYSFYTIATVWAVLTISLMATNLIIYIKRNKSKEQ